MQSIKSATCKALCNRCLGVFRVEDFLTLNLVKSLIICDLLVAWVVSSWKKFTKKVNYYGSYVLSGDAARPGKNAARVFLGSVCRKPVKEVWLQRDKNQDDGQRLQTGKNWYLCIVLVSAVYLPQLSVTAVQSISCQLANIWWSSFIVHNRLRPKIRCPQILHLRRSTLRCNFRTTCVFGFGLYCCVSIDYAHC